MSKKRNLYRIQLEQLEAKNDDPTPEPLALTFDNHDDVFAIIERLKAKNPFDDVEQAAQFALGLKMFSEVMIKHRNHPLFEELMPVFGSFMQKLKALP
jgi:hypothetical protein